MLDPPSEYDCTQVLLPKDYLQAGANMMHSNLRIGNKNEFEEGKQFFEDTAQLGQLGTWAAGQTGLPSGVRSGLVEVQHVLYKAILDPRRILPEPRELELCRYRRSGRLCIYREELQSAPFPACRQGRQDAGPPGC